MQKKRNLIDYKKVLRMRHLTGNFISMQDCYQALALSEGSVYNAIRLLHDKRIKDFSEVLKLDCRNKILGGPRRCYTGTSFFVYKKFALSTVYEIVPTCKNCFDDCNDDINMLITMPQFKQLCDGEEFNDVCPEIVAAQVIDS